MPGMNLQLDEKTNRALSLLCIRHAPAATKSELLRGMIIAAAESDPVVRGWLQAFPEADERLAARELVIG